MKITHSTESNSFSFVVAKGQFHQIANKNVRNLQFSETGLHSGEIEIEGTWRTLSCSELLSLERELEAFDNVSEKEAELNETRARYLPGITYVREKQSRLEDQRSTILRTKDPKTLEYSLSMTNLREEKAVVDRELSTSIHNWNMFEEDLFYSYTSAVEELEQVVLQQQYQGIDNSEFYRQASSL